jgi:hypothetical protein
MTLLHNLSTTAAQQLTHQPPTLPVVRPPIAGGHR